MKALRKIFGLVGLFALCSGTAFASPTTVTHQNIASCDFLSLGPNVDELGRPPVAGEFPTDEQISANDQPTAYTPCTGAPDEILLDNTEVTITNLTTHSFTDLWYVADPETSLFNADGTINGELAFKIDSIGLNTPLIYESITADQIFEAGETWIFVIQDYSNTLSLTASDLDSIGVGSFSGTDTVSSGSIIAIVPEPDTALLLAAGLLGLRISTRRLKNT